MPEMNIDLEGRKLVKAIIKEQTAERIVQTSVYDDGSEVTFVQTAEGIDISSNRTLQVQADGKTIKLV